MNKSIKITCDSGAFESIKNLETFQGDLKTLAPEDLEKLKESILKYGFSFPIFIWDGKILDGHQRLKAVKSLIQEGYSVDGGLLPVAHIDAKDQQEAAEKLLLINSRYAQIDQSGFDLFTEKFSIDLDEISKLIEIPEIDFIPKGETDYESEWDGMPELGQEDKTPYRSIIVHFEEEKHVNDFIKLINQEISNITKYIYYPKKERFNAKDKAFIDTDES